VSITDISFCGYSWEFGLQWTNSGEGLTRCTIAQHNSALGMAASVSDFLTAPADFVPKGTQNANAIVYPKRVYYGPLKAWDKKTVPLLGSITHPVGHETNNIRFQMAMAIWEAVRQLSNKVTLYKPTKPATAPSAYLLRSKYPAGLIAVTGVCGKAILPYDDPKSTIDEPEEAKRLARLMNPALAIADAVTAASAAGADIDAAAATVFTGMNSDVKVNVQVYDQMAVNSMTRRKKIALGVGATVLGLAVAAGAFMKVKSGAAALPALGKGA